MKVYYRWAFLSLFLLGWVSLTMVRFGMVTPEPIEDKPVWYIGSLMMVLHGMSGYWIVSALRKK